MVEKVIFHGKEWKRLEFNLVKIETDKGITVVGVKPLVILVGRL